MLGMVVKNSPTPVPTIAPMMINTKKMIVSLLLFKKGFLLQFVCLIHILLARAKSCDISFFPDNRKRASRPYGLLARI